jgi:methionine sulfoxide reductase heme-binding subunit
VGGVSASAPSHYIWWLASRSAGMVAMGLVTASVLLGLAMAARLVPAGRRKDAVRAHEQLALLSLVSIGTHGLLLLGDPWLHPGLGGIAVPLVIAYRTVWTGLGILGGYLAAILGLSFYARRRIGARLWRRLHRLTAVVYLLGLAHALGAGTDAQIPLVKDALLASAAPVVALMGLRLARSHRRAGDRESRAKEKAWAMWRRSTTGRVSRKAIAWKPLLRRSASTTTPS